jgi:DNA-binding NtrC family response regulator
MGDETSEIRRDRGKRRELDERPLGLYVVSSPDADKVDRFFAAAASLAIGRGPGAGPRVAIDDRRLSRDHALVRRAEGRVGIEDQGSRNGTYVNGARVTSAELRPGDLLRLGETLLELCELDASAPPPLVEGELVTRAPALLHLVGRVDRAAAAGIPVLLCGESGTGKELLAQRLHRLSGRPGSFVALNCAAIPSTLVESLLFGHRRGAFTGATSDSAGFFLGADRGTLFLDEIGELATEVQAKLLRVLETGEVVRVGGADIERCDVRLCAATNADLDARVAAGSFRGDLYARLAGLVLRVPPLRERRRDVPLLARHLVRRAAPARRLVLRADFLEGLMLHAWPRNVRELRMAMERVAILCDGDVIDATALAIALADPPASEARDARAGVAPTRDELVTLLETHRGNVAQLAAALGKDTRQIYRWLKKLEIEVSEYRAR